VPFRPQGHDLTVELDRDAPAHAHHHRLAVHRREAVLEVAYEITGDKSESILRPDDGLQLRPLALQLLLALDLFALGHLLEPWINERPL
jgi:hypothetical protein